MDGRSQQLFRSPLPRKPGFRRALAWFSGCLFLLLLGQFPSSSPAEQASGDSHRWKYVGGDVVVRELAHQAETNPPDGTTIEQIVLEAGPGTAAYYVSPLPPAPLIEEMQAAVLLKANCPGLQVFLSVVLPRAQHPVTGEPLTVLIPGEQYRVAGEWEQLFVRSVGPALQREVRALRLQIRRDIDVREAYVDGIVLNLYGGPGTTNVRIGPVQLQGFLSLAGVGTSTLGSGDAAMPPRDTPVRSLASTRPADSPPGVSALLFPKRLPREWLNTPLASSGELDWNKAALRSSEVIPVQYTTPPVEMVGSVLRVDGKPFFPRAIEYQGEPFELLLRLGFNTVWIRRPIDERLLVEARQQGLAVILRPEAKLLGIQEAGIQRTIGPSYDGVIAWDMGTQSSPQEVEELKHLAERLRSADPMVNRPILAEPLTKLLAVSRAVEGLVIGRNPVFGDLELADYGTWLRSRSLIARPGTPVWVAVPTQPDPAVISQWQQWGLSSDQLDRIPADQVRVLTYLALTAGARALLFPSQTSLSRTDEATRERCLALELMNRELEWIEPFLAAGQFLSIVPSDQHEVIGALFRTDRARLLVPLWLGPRAQFVPGQAAVDQVTFVIPGVPESNSPYLLLPNTLEPLDGERVAGGMRLRLKEFGPTSLIVLTQDPTVLSFLASRARSLGPRIVQLERALAEMTIRHVQRQHQVLMKYGPFVPQADSWFRMAAQEIASADQSIAAGDYPTAFRHIHRAIRPILLIRRSDWEAFALPLKDVVSWPAATSFDTLAGHLLWMDKLLDGAWGQNRLPGGCFEDGGQITAMGWQPYQHAIPGILAQAEVSSTAARSGSFGLLISVRATQRDQAKALVESPPIWVESPPIPVQAGEWICLEGWVSIPQPITGSVDGLMIVDSLGGEVLSRRIGHTVGWQPFRVYRRAASDGQIRITFVMTGLGEVCLDDISVKALSSRSQGPPENPGESPPLTPIMPQPLAGIGR
ncbi:MAG: hypothetical protein ACUVQG_01050 [Thermogutta sp.]